MFSILLIWLKHLYLGWRDDEGLHFQRIVNAQLCKSTERTFRTFKKRTNGSFQRAKRLRVWCCWYFNSLRTFISEENAAWVLIKKTKKMHNQIRAINNQFLIEKTSRSDILWYKLSVMFHSLSCKCFWYCVSSGRCEKATRLEVCSVNFTRTAYGNWGMVSGRQCLCGRPFLCTRKTFWNPLFSIMPSFEVRYENRKFMGNLPLGDCNENKLQWMSFVQNEQYVKFIDRQKWLKIWE